MSKDKLVIEALNDYIGFLFSYSKELEERNSELEHLIFSAKEKSPDELHGECLAFSDINSKRENLIKGRS